MATTQGSRSGRARSTTQSSGGSKNTTASKPKTVTVHLPLMTAEVRRPEMPRLPELSMPRLPEVNLSRLSSDVTQSVSGAVNTVRSNLPSASDVRDNLPSREQMAYYGGLGLLTAFAVIEWPVAVAIGAGTMIAQRGSAQQSSSSSSTSSSSPSSSSTSSSSSGSAQSGSRSDRSSD